ncbi:hypothetical protein PG996_005993 [Apiospora saccharicola]|uniref:Uncharacterized protein n=1 Tax=Apiospora saccharicola TaxID=335842 RepID=A0ABR1VN34_9PEZI
MVYDRVLIGKNGSILGKIKFKESEPIKMSERYEIPDSVLEFDRRATYLAQFRTVAVSSRPSSPESTGSQERPVMSEAIADYRDRARSLHPFRSSSSPSSSARRTTSERRPGRSSSSSSAEACRRPHLEDHREFSLSQLGNGSTMRRAVRNLLKEDGRRTQPYAAEESYVPSPKITFLIDQPKLTCQICQATTLKLAPDDDTPSQGTSTTTSPKIPPRESDGCPFCRVAHRRPGCGHRVGPRQLTHATISSLPATKPEGGRIAPDCDSCSAKKRERRARDKMAGLAERYVRAREEAEQRPHSGQAQLALKTAKKAFERCGLDIGYEEVMAEHTAW